MSGWHPIATARRDGSFMFLRTPRPVERDHVSGVRDLNSDVARCFVGGWVDGQHGAPSGWFATDLSCSSYAYDDDAGCDAERIALDPIMWAPLDLSPAQDEAA